MLGNLLQLNHSQLHPSPPPRSVGVVCVNSEDREPGRGVGDTADANATPPCFWTEGLGKLIVPQPHLEHGSIYRALRPT